MTTKVEFKATPAEYQKIKMVVVRALKLAKELDLTYDKQSLEMDLDACHSNGCLLDFDKLLAFDDGNFGHDVFGIARFIDRTTGKLGRCFLPRCSKPKK